MNLYQDKLIDIINKMKDQCSIAIIIIHDDSITLDKRSVGLGTPAKVVIQQHLISKQLRDDTAN